MSSQEELTFVAGRGLLLLEVLLDVVRRVNPAPTSGREQVRTAADRRFGRGSFEERSET